MKLIFYLTLMGGIIILALAFGFIFRLPIATGLWPSEDGSYSYLFIGSLETLAHLCE